MIKQFIDNFKLRKHTLIILLTCLLVFFLMGFTIIYLILKFDHTAVSWFPLGTILAILGIVIFAIISFIWYYPDFMLALSMGKTRRHFMITYATEQFIKLLIAYIVLLLLALLEEAIYPILFPDAYEKFNLLSYLTDWRIIIPTLLSLTIITMFFGALYSRFGRAFGITLYVLSMLTCLLMPRQISYYETLNVSSPVGNYKIVNMFLSLSPIYWMIFGFTVATIMIIITIRLGLKQMVK